MLGERSCGKMALVMPDASASSGMTLVDPLGMGVQVHFILYTLHLLGIVVQVPRRTLGLHICVRV